MESSSSFHEWLLLWTTFETCKIDISSNNFLLLLFHFFPYSREFLETTIKVAKVRRSSGGIFDTVWKLKSLVIAASKCERERKIDIKICFVSNCARIYNVRGETTIFGWWECRHCWCRCVGMLYVSTLLEQLVLTVMSSRNGFQFDVVAIAI